MQEIFNKLLESLLNVLPLSPFQQWLDTVGNLPYLGWLNWFFPVGDCIAVVFAWLGVIGLFYLYSIAMRWLKVIGD